MGWLLIPESHERTVVPDTEEERTAATVGHRHDRPSDVGSVRLGQLELGPLAFTSLAAFYHLRDSFWVESLPADPEIPDTTSKVVVVGLIPGNLPLPSSMSTYSKRPASARCARW
jgi:hypothetical protein